MLQSTSVKQSNLNQKPINQTTIQKNKQQRTQQEQKQSIQQEIQKSALAKLHRLIRKDALQITRSSTTTNTRTTETAQKGSTSPKCRYNQKHPQQRTPTTTTPEV